MGECLLREEWINRQVLLDKRIGRSIASIDSVIDREIVNNVALN